VFERGKAREEMGNLQGGKAFDCLKRGRRMRGQREAMEVVPFDGVERTTALGDQTQPQGLGFDGLGARLARRPVRFRVLRHHPIERRHLERRRVSVPRRRRGGGNG